MRFYNQAAKEAARKQSLSGFDNTSNNLLDTTWGSSDHAMASFSLSDNNTKVEQVYQQLALLKKQLQTPTSSKIDPVNSSYENELPYPKDYIAEANATRQANELSALTNTTNEDSSVDPEMQQLNSMLDKVLAIQHPEKVENGTQEKAIADRKPLVVDVDQKAVPVSLIASESNSFPKDSGEQFVAARNRFYGLDVANVSIEVAGSFPAIIYGQQSLVNGSTVQLMLTRSITINGNLIAKNSFVFGKASLQGERLLIEIQSIRNKNTILPVRLSVYDLDGLKGIYIPGAINRDVAKESSDRAIQGMGLSSFNTSLGAQAAAAGMEAAKALWSKKVKLIRVSIPSGYQVLLYDEAHLAL